MKLSKLCVLFFIFAAFANGYGQDLLGGRLSGNFQFEAQTSKEDEKINSEKVREGMLSNGFLNLNYNSSSFDVGMRYESYLNPILGIDSRYKGSGIPYRYVTYHSDELEVTAGDFYEQFGSGMIFRSYEERQLGIDNAMDGFRIKFRPTAGVRITGVVGKQRNFWDKGTGLVRGADFNFSAAEILGDLWSNEYNLDLGASFVSRYQEDDDVFYFLPENVFAYALRANFSGSWFTVNTEYAKKYNDPSSTNKKSYTPGKGLIVSASVFGDGIGFSAEIHHIDNMDFRSQREAQNTELLLSYIPAITRQHTYRLPSMYPYATLLNGEFGMQYDFTYKFKRNSFLGGKYGTTMHINYSQVNSIDTTQIDEYTHESKFLGIGDELFYRDLNISFEHRISKDLKAHLSYVYILYNKDIMENEGAPFFGDVTSNSVIADLTYKLASRTAIKGEIEHMWSRNDWRTQSKIPDNMNGNWIMGLAELTLNSNWFISVFDEYNYGNEWDEKQIHYVKGAVAYVHETTRVSVEYGKQRGGILCVGGVCRTVPAANGFYLSITSSF